MDLIAVYEIIPEKLAAKVFHHYIETQKGQTKCLAYLTDGFAALGRHEILLILKKRSEIYEVLEDPFGFFELAYQSAVDGRFASASDVVQFGQDNIAGWKGAVFIHPPIVVEEEIPANCLCMVLLSEKETLNMPSIGHLRIMSILGNLNKYYPFPYWSDIERDEIDVKTVVEKSITSKVSCVNFPFGTASVANNAIVFRIPINIHVDSLPREVVHSSSPVAFLLALNKDADGCLVWNFESQAPLAITQAGSKGANISGCTLVLVGERESNMAMIAEDGFYMALTNDAWRQFWEALIRRKPLTITPDDGSLLFSLEWI